MCVVTIVANGQRIPRGKLIVEAGGTCVSEVRVSEECYPFCERDAWTLSETVLKQLVAFGVDLVRLRVREAGELLVFLKEAEKLDRRGWRFQTERQFALPRSKWRLVKRGGAQPEQLFCHC